MSYDSPSVAYSGASYNSGDVVENPPENSRRGKHYQETPRDTKKLLISAVAPVLCLLVVAVVSAILYFSPRDAEDLAQDITNSYSQKDWERLYDLSCDNTKKKFSRKEFLSQMTGMDSFMNKTTVTYESDDVKTKGNSGSLMIKFSTTIDGREAPLMTDMKVKLVKENGAWKPCD